MDGYALSRQFFDWCYENPDLVNPNHVGLYFFIIEHNNRLGWKEKFGLPMQMSMDAIGIKNYKTWSKTFKDLIEWGFIAVYQISKNQYSANVIGLVKITKAKSKAMDKAMLKHSQKQVLEQGEKQVHGIVGIDKQETINQEPLTNETIIINGELKIFVSSEEKNLKEISELFDVDVGLRRNWLQKGLPEKNFLHGVELFMIRHFGKKYPDLHDVRNHFQNWLPNYLLAAEKAKENAKNVRNNQAGSNGQADSGKQFIGPSGFGEL